MRRSFLLSPTQIRTIVLVKLPLNRVLMSEPTREFKRGDLVYNHAGKIGRVSIKGRRFIVVDYANSYHFMTAQVAYPKASAHEYLRHFTPGQGGLDECSTLKALVE